MKHRNYFFWPLENSFVCAWYATDERGEELLQEFSGLLGLSNHGDPAQAHEFCVLSTIADRTPDAPDAEAVKWQLGRQICYLSGDKHVVYVHALAGKLFSTRHQIELYRQLNFLGFLPLLLSGRAAVIPGRLVQCGDRLVAATPKHHEQGIIPEMWRQYTWDQLLVFPIGNRWMAKALPNWHNYFWYGTPLVRFDTPAVPVDGFGYQTTACPETDSETNNAETYFSYLAETIGNIAADMAPPLQRPLRDAWFHLTNRQQIN